MINDRKLAAVLGEFARPLATDFPIQAIIDHLVERIVGVLPITSAGVTLISGGTGPLYVAASDAAALRFEQFQTASGQGPCMTACQTGLPVSVVDLRLPDVRFPEFCDLAAAGGLGAVFTFPLHHGRTGVRLGALDLYRDRPGPLDLDDLDAAETLADVTTAYLLNAQARNDLHLAADSLLAGALHDPLTGLANRVLLQERLQHTAARAQRSHALAAVLFADLDAFKSVNDTYGHAIGDELLIAVAHRISGLLRPGDTLARIAGDEFVILCENVASRDDVDALAVRIDESFTRPFTLRRPFAASCDGGDVDVDVDVDVDAAGDIDVCITASVGIAFSGPANRVDFQLVRDADTAMYQAKRKGGGAHQVIDLREADVAADRVTLGQDLRTALADGELALAYQPIVRPGSGVIVGVEALLRWTHPTRGSIPAQLTVSLAEDSALIEQIGAWVLERACTDQVTWNLSRPTTPLMLAVNVSPRQLMSAGFCESVARTITTTGADASALTLEVTESIFLADGDRAMAVLTELRRLGLRVALDDFGTGYSSLSYLRQFPVDVVKIDQGFIADIGHGGPSSAIISAVASLAHALGMGVVAEGVETAEQREAVIAVGCESAQGYFYARPLSLPALNDLLAASPAG